MLLLDVTFFGRGYGILVCRDPHRKKNVYWHEVTSETTAEYKKAKEFLEAHGVTFLAIVIDGRRGIKELFTGVPVQMCQFHQIKTVTKYLTRKPKLEAAIELKSIVLQLTKLSEKEFTKLLTDWYEKWKGFLKEQTTNPKDKTKWNYTHKKIRSAYYSLERNLPYLFTFERYPKLEIPNTTNSIDGYFSVLKDLLRVHRGMSEVKRYLLISEILAK